MAKDLTLPDDSVDLAKNVTVLRNGPCEIIQSIVISLRTIHYFTGQAPLPNTPPCLAGRSRQSAV